MGLIMLIAMAFILHAYLGRYEPEEPVDWDYQTLVYKVSITFSQCIDKLINAKAYPIPHYYLGTGEKLALSSGEMLEGEFVFLKNEDSGSPWVITGYKTSDGTIWTGIPEIPADAHIKAFVGALSHPGMSSSLEELLDSLAERGEVTADVTKLNGITQDRFMSEYFKDDMRKAWGAALIKVLEGAAERFTVDKKKPWLIRLYAPKEPICS